MTAAALRAVTLGAVLLAAGGCAGLLSHYDRAPNGLREDDARLRRALAAGADSAVIDQAVAAAPDDLLLRLLYQGVAAHYAGEWQASSEALNAAAALAEDRYTESLSRGALSLIANDKALAYEPGRTERLLIHYYSALNYLRRGLPDEAAVEARRLSALLERDQAPDDDRLRAFLRRFAGAVFEAAGQMEDAGVAYRNARALLGEDPWTAPEPPPDSLGEVVVILERGFVAHRVEQSLNVLLGPWEVAALTGGEDGRVRAAANVSARVLEHALAADDYVFEGDAWRRTLVVPGPPEPPPHAGVAMGQPHVLRCDDRPSVTGDPPPRARPRTAVVRKPADGEQADSGSWSLIGDLLDGERSDSAGDCTAGSRAHDDEDEDEPNPYLLRVAWPVMLRGATSHAQALVVAENGLAAEPSLTADVSGGVIADFGQERGLLLARTVARAAAKMAVTKGLEKELSEEDELLGRLVGLLGNVGTSLLEQADTRSLHLLPDRLEMVRIALPPGTHELTLRLDGAGRSRTVPIGAVEVEAGEVRVVAMRTWR